MTDDQYGPGGGEAAGISVNLPDTDRVVAVNRYAVRQSPDGLDLWLRMATTPEGSDHDAWCVTILPAAAVSTLQSNREGLERLMTEMFLRSPKPPGALDGLDENSLRVYAPIANAVVLSVSPLGGTVLIGYVNPTHVARAKPGQALSGQALVQFLLPPNVFGHLYMDLMRASDELASRIESEFPYLLGPEAP